MKKKIIIFLALIIAVLAAYFITTTNNTIVILHTNDIHSAIDKNIGYAGFSAYKIEAEEQFGSENVVAVDIGDTIQGNSIGTLTEGSAAISIMNAVGYDFFTPGNHDFDFSVIRLLELTRTLEAQTLSSNFIDLNTNKPVFAPYAIKSFDVGKIAFLGISNPNFISKSTPTYFQNDKGEFIYSFYGSTDDPDFTERFYNTVQENVDKARSEGADFVVVLGHLGSDDTDKPYRSIDVIENTIGIDVFLDAENHAVVEEKIIKNKFGEKVVLAQAGTKLEHFGVITINMNSGEISSRIIGSEYTVKDPQLQTAIDIVNEQLEPLLFKLVAYTNYPLVVLEGSDEIARTQETNGGNFVADAYRIVCNADIGLVNAGSIRSNINKGPISYRGIVDLMPFNNDVNTAKVTGQMIKDALEMGVREYAKADGAFFQVSGLSYEVNIREPSSVIIDERGNFVEVQGKYRVQNIMVGDEPLELAKEYVVASSNFIIRDLGDGMTMFKNAKLDANSYFTDHDLLIKYLSENLNGNVSSNYENLSGEGRIKIIK